MCFSITVGNVVGQFVANVVRSHPHYHCLVLSLMSECVKNVTIS